MDQDQILTLVLALLAATGPHIYNWLKVRSETKLTDASAREKSATADSIVITNLTNEVKRLTEENEEIRDKLAALEDVHFMLKRERERSAGLANENMMLRAELTNTRADLAKIKAELAEERKLREVLQERVKQLEKKATGPIGAAGAPAQD